MAGLSDLQGWFVPWIPAIATIVVAYLAARPLLKEAGLKREAEKRLAESAQVESDARLLATFVELMGKAHARGATTLAESATEAIISSGGPLAPKDLKELNDLVGAAVAVHPVGAAEVEAAIAAVAELGIRHPLLLEPALAGLSQIATWNKTSKALPSALEMLKAGKGALKEQL
ncbi:MAG: hypothetical protein E6G58_12245 [Actinobacteria bacterium]|nr:MAG: hypothetical protein E6G58_12245 [Actinomycetota bacterium]